MTNGFQEIGGVDTASGLGADLRTAIDSVERYEETGQDLEVALGLLRGLLPNIEPPKVSERLERFATLELAPETQNSLDRDLREGIARLEAEAEAIWHDDWPYEEKDIWKPTQWLVPGWIPAGRVSLLSGEGAVGKTRVAMQIAAAVALGKPNAFLGETSLPLSPAFTGEPAPVCWVSWETAPGDFQKRLRAANGISEDVSELRGWVRYKRASKPAWGVGEGAHMATRGAQLSAGAKILEYAESIGTRLLVLDPLAGAFAGNENERPVVRAFLTWLSVWAERTGCTIIVLSHPPKTREAYSGSTDWRNGAQALLTALLEAAGPAGDAISRLNALPLSGRTKRMCGELEQTVDRVAAAAPGLGLTVDPVEFRGMEYQTGVSFTVFTPRVHSEIGRGGRYELDTGESATGFTLFMDALVRALPAPHPDRLVYVPHGTSPETSARLRADGWRTLQALSAGDDDTAEARRLRCSHILRDDDVVEVT